jgi:hypothetical protein
MSKETVQFIEMIRQALVKTSRATRQLYCDICRKYQTFDLHYKDDYTEQYICPECRVIKTYRIK